MSDNGITNGVNNLLGSPKRAVLSISAPIAFGMFVQSVYNIIDGVWVSGLGRDALSAVGLFFPLFMCIISISSGMGIGGSAAVSRNIGKGDKTSAGSAAVHTIIIGVFTGILVAVCIFPFLGRIFTSAGVEPHVAGSAAGYARILLFGSVLLIFSGIAGGILRGEGDSRRAMYVMLLGAVLNMCLDPLFIYKLDMGVRGAAWATVVSVCASCMLSVFWFFVKKDTYVDIVLRRFRPDGRILKEILRVGLPASFAQISMFLAMFILNIIIIKAGGTGGVAVFTSAWRIIIVGIVPLVGIAGGVTAVTAAAYGAKDIDRLKKAYMYGIKAGVFIELAAAVIIIVFARQISHIFTYSRGTAPMAGELISAFRCLVWFLPGVPFGMLTSAMFQGTGRGENALAVNILRTIVMQVSFSYIIGIMFGHGIKGVWFGIVSGNITASFISFVWGRAVIKRLKGLYVPSDAKLMAG